MSLQHVRGIEGERKPPMCHFDTLGVDEVMVEVEGMRKALDGIMVEGEGTKKAPNVSK